MATIQLATRVEQEQAEMFKSIAKQLGTTSSDALRMFVSAFNACKGFPYDVRVGKLEVESFATEEEATHFATDLAMRMLNEAR